MRQHFKRPIQSTEFNNDVSLIITCQDVHCIYNSEKMIKICHYIISVLNHIQDWFVFTCSCFGLGKNNRSGGKAHQFSFLRVINSPPVLTNAPKKLSAGRPCCFYRNVKFTCIVVQRKSNCKGQRTQLIIRFAFC